MAKSSKISPPAKTDIAFPHELFSKVRLYPGEESVTFEGFRTALLTELNPGTPYQHTIAGQIIALEWEMSRHRRLRDATILSEIKALSMGLYDKGVVKKHNEYTDEISDEAARFARLLTSDDPK